MVVFRETGYVNALRELVEDPDISRAVNLPEHVSDGTTLLTFYHRQLREAVNEQYLAAEHGPRRHADPKGDRTWVGSYSRGLSELPFHLAEAGELNELYETLTNFKFLGHKVAEVGVAEHEDAEGNKSTTYTGAFEFQNDYELALVKLGGRSSAAKKPLIVTGVDFGKGMVILCPWCNKSATSDEEWRGADISGPNPDCKGPLSVNKFVVGESLLEMG